MESIKIGMVGGGYAGEKYCLPGYQSHPNTDVVAISDIDESTLDNFASKYSINNLYSDYENMIENHNLDIINIATPPATHEEIFKSAAYEKCHIFCEKPLTTSLESAKRMVTYVKNNNIKAKVGYLPSHFDNYNRIQALLNSDVTGKVNRVHIEYMSSNPTSSWHNNREISGGGVVMDKLPHILDFYIDVLGEEIKVLEADLQNVECDVENYAEICLDISGVTVDILLSWKSDQFHSDNRVILENGYLKYNYEKIEGSINNSDINFKYGDPPVVDLILEQFYSPKRENAHKKRILSFIDTILEKNENTTDIEKAIKISEVIDRVYELK